jgi:hypothetical protein
LFARLKSTIRGRHQLSDSHVVEVISGGGEAGFFILEGKVDG